MDLFSLIVSYLYGYIFEPLGNGLNEYFYCDDNPLYYSFYIYEGKLTFGFIEDFTIETAEGVIIHINHFTLIDLLVLLTTIVIFILLFIVAVKFIVWLFKQISFITRF